MMQGACTTILIAHRLSTILHADTIIVMSAGKVVGQGTHASLLASHPIYQELYEKYYRKESKSLEGDEVRA
jgi:ABC-type multidrug transport system fused ATPase/permease subunit